MSSARRSKRARSNELSEEESADDESVTSGLSASHKRPRISSALDEGEETRSSLAGPDDGRSEPTTYANNPLNHQHDTDDIHSVGSDYEAGHRYDGNTPESHDAEPEGHNPEAENAIIEEIQCTNFMCHARLHLSLGPHINFIIGHNGSGKSAALTALQLCLGGRATNTNRGQKLSDFIKHGENQATLSVRIKNKGVSAYRSQEYGDSIIIERSFNRQGVSNFKIKNAERRILSTKKSDVEDITDAFALQLDNPMICLTQDQAREFLNNSGPREKYKFFLKGTQLEALDNDYTILGEQIDHLTHRLEGLAEDKKEAQQSFRAAKSKSDEAKQVTGLEDKFASYRRQMAWVQVQEQEELRDRFGLQIQQTDEKIVQARQVADNMSDEFSNADVAFEELKTEITESQANLQPHLTERDALAHQHEGCTKGLVEIQVQERSINGTIQTAKRQKLKIEKDIEDEQTHIREANGGQHAAKLAEFQSAKDAADQAHADLVEHGRGSHDLDIAKEAAAKLAHEAKQQVIQNRDELKACSQNVKALENSRGQWLKAYPNNMRQLLNAIESETRFREKPVGPCGRYIRILQPEWTSIIERSFGQHLGAFCVTNVDDQRILSELMRRTSVESLILIGDKNPIDTSRNEPDTQLQTWARILEFDNDLVRNQAIINQGIDQTVLIRSREEAADFMDPRTHNGRPPLKVKQCFAMHDTRHGEGHRFGFSSSGGESMAPIARWTGISRMQTDSEYQIDQEKQHLRVLQDRLQDAEQHQRRQETSWKHAGQAIIRHKREQNQLQLREQETRDRAEQLQDELEAAATRPDRLNGLQTQLREAEEECRNAENQIHDVAESRSDLRRQQSELDQKIKEVEELIHDRRTQEKRDNKRLQHLSKSRDEALYKKNEAYERINDAEAELQALRTRRDQQDATVQDHTRQASEVSARVPIEPGLTGAMIDRIMDRLEQQIENARRQMGGRPEELRRKTAAAKARYQTAAIQHKQSIEICQAFKHARTERTRRWRLFRQLISSRAAMHFKMLLGERKFRGELSFLHKRKLLDIKVEPDATRESAEGRQSKTLSGGEKSFSTICLLLSLWDAMGNPISCLDEFDVFMDSVNRAVSTGLMIDAARKSIGKQFILISPQGVENSQKFSEVKIIKMTDPERGQQPLPSNFTRGRN